jgi:hypothetical protein
MESQIGFRLKNSVFWDGTSCGSSNNRRFGGTYRLHHQPVVFDRRVLLMLVTANVLFSLPILDTLIMDEIRSSETPVLQGPDGAISQKTAFLIDTAVKS